MKVIIFGDLYSFLEERVDQKAIEYGLPLVEQFCEEHDVSFKKLKPVLDYFGIHEDYKAVFSLSGLIDDKAVMPSNEEHKQRDKMIKACEQREDEWKYGEDFAEAQWEAKVKQYDEAQAESQHKKN